MKIQLIDSIIAFLNASGVSLENNAERKDNVVLLLTNGKVVISDHVEVGSSTDELEYFDAKKAKLLSSNTSVASKEVIKVLGQVKAAAYDLKNSIVYDGYLSKSDIKQLEYRGFGVKYDVSFRNEQLYTITW